MYAAEFTIHDHHSANLPEFSDDLDINGKNVTFQCNKLLLSRFSP